MDGCRPGWVQKLWKLVSFTAVACFAFNFVPAGGWQWVDSHALSKEWQQHWTSSPLQFDRPKIPAEGKIKLSETILSISRNNKVIVSYATISVLDHLFNFLCHLKQLSLAKHVMVFAADQKVYDILRRKNITAWPAYLSFEVEDPETESGDLALELEYLESWTKRSPLIPKACLRRSPVGNASWIC